MSLLQQDSPVLDDAARGDDLTKGSSHLVWAAIVAAVVVTVAVAVYVLAGEKPPAATGEIVEVWAHPQHTETSGFDANGAAMAKETFDQVMVFAHVKLHNQSDKPLFLHGVTANATMDDGIHSSYAASASDYDRVFLAYPDIKVPHGPGLALESTLNPGQTLEGTAVSAFRMSKQEWDARKGLDFTFEFQYQPSLKLAPQSAVIAR